MLWIGFVKVFLTKSNLLQFAVNGEWAKKVIASSIMKGTNKILNRCLWKLMHKSASASFPIVNQMYTATHSSKFTKWPTKLTQWQQRNFHLALEQLNMCLS